MHRAEHHVFSHCGACDSHVRKQKHELWNHHAPADTLVPAEARRSVAALEARVERLLAEVTDAVELRAQVKKQANELFLERQRNHAEEDAMVMRIRELEAEVKRLTPFAGDVRLNRPFQAKGVEE